MRLAAAILGCGVFAACGAEQPATAPGIQAAEDSFKQWRLPRRLREISGLALTRDGRLFAVTDERAIVYELDYAEGNVVKSFALGDPVARGDFEGIAVLGDTVWLMTSDGALFAAEEGRDGQRVAYRRYDTREGEYCELEGLAQDPGAGTLLMACKETRSGKDKLRLSEWSVTPAGVEHRRDIFIPEDAVSQAIDEKRVNPSGVALDPHTGEWVLVAARQRALFRLSADGGISHAIILPKKSRHRQAEGIELTLDGRLLIADEGDGGRARLAVYADDPGRDNDE